MNWFVYEKSVCKKRYLNVCKISRHKEEKLDTTCASLVNLQSELQAEMIINNAPL